MSVKLKLCKLIGHKPRGPIRFGGGGPTVYRCARCEAEIVFDQEHGWQIT
jgi:hypothetical protein